MYITNKSPKGAVTERESPNMLKLLIYGIKRDDGNHLDPDAAIDMYYYYRKNNAGIYDRFMDYRQNVVNKVKSNAYGAYTYRNGKVGAKCIVKTSQNGIEYLKTVPNGDPTDNISSLPEIR